jgi:hypothetical protein
MGKGLPGGRRQAGSMDYRTNRGALSSRIDHGARYCTTSKLRSRSIVNLIPRVYDRRIHDTVEPYYMGLGV